MIEENNIENENIEENVQNITMEQQNIEEVDVREKPVLELSELSNDDLMEFYSKIDEHIKYLSNNILIEEDENNE